MKYNFDLVVPRRGTESVKWDSCEGGVLPMWVADMDFPAAPEILEALQKRLDHGVFGYELVPDDYFTLQDEWFSSRHGWKGLTRETLIPTTGVIAAYSAAIKAMTVPGDKVMVFTPCYNAFFPAIRNNKCVQLDCPLKYEGGVWGIDWEDFETKASDARVLLLCNPHNPVGRVWRREELERIGKICLDNGVFVISDEIHCELTYPGHDYTPWATLPREMVLNSVTCMSPTKPFNLAGIQIANIYALDPEIYKKMDRAINDNECCDVNVFGVAALKAAYRAGGPWLDELREYLLDNARAVYCFLEDELPQVVASPLEGTYLMWLDFRALFEVKEGLSDALGQYLEHECGLKLSVGTIYGPVAEGFMRLNIACPRSLLQEGLQRLAAGIRFLMQPRGGHCCHGHGGCGRETQSPEN
ncbi:MAG: pyridoxal phosphate-dependent aminotransferase [Bacteroidales bacterium]|nr:pyridoxal phosphate-dependent aminotransferase [Bacteroidales bacterium]